MNQTEKILFIVRQAALEISELENIQDSVEWERRRSYVDLLLKLAQVELSVSVVANMELIHEELNTIAAIVTQDSAYNGGFAIGLN